MATSIALVFVLTIVATGMNKTENATLGGINIFGLSPMLFGLIGFFVGFFSALKLLT